MKATFQLKMLTLALAAGLASGAAMAGNRGGEGGGDQQTYAADFKLDGTVNLNWTDNEHSSSTKVSYSSKKRNSESISTRGHIDVEGDLIVTGKADASADGKQTSYYNNVDNDPGTKNKATMGAHRGDPSVTVGSTGNFGANVAAGDNNQQENTLALASADLSFVTGGGDKGCGNNGRCGGDNHHDPKTTSGGAAIAFSSGVQDAEFNHTSNQGTTNTATLGSTLDIQGNGGINVAAGDSNQQRNAMSLASATSAILASATASNLQVNDHNWTENSCGTTNTATLSSGITASGNLGLNVVAGTNNQQSNTLVVASTK